MICKETTKEIQLRDVLNTNSTPISYVKCLKHRVGGLYYEIVSEPFADEYEAEEAKELMEDLLPEDCLIESACVDSTLAVRMKVYFKV